MLDEAEGLARFGGQQEAYLSVLRRFAKDHGADVEELERLLQAQRSNKALRLLHTLKGAAGNIAAHRVFLLSGRLEVLLSQSQTYAESLANLRDEMQQLLARIAEVTADLAPGESQETSRASLEELRTRMTTLYQRVQAHDYIGQDEYEFLGELPLALVEEEAVQALQQCLQTFDYDDARHHIQRLMTQLER